MNLKETIANNDIMSNAITNFDRIKPGLGVVVGLIGIGVSTWLTWRAGRKHDRLMEEIHESLEEVHKDRPVEVVDAETGEPVKAVGPSGLTMKEYRHKLYKCYGKITWDIFKLYGPPALLAIASGGCILSGFHEEHERFTGASAAAALVANGFHNYRKNVIETLGEDADQEFRFGVKDRTVTVPDLNKNGEQKLDKNGEPKTKVEHRRVMEKDISEYSEYARIFDRYHSTQFEFDPKTGIANDEYNRKFLLDTEAYFNRMLKYRANHTVFLNEVYDALGYELTEAGQYVGWHYDKNCPEGDNVIEFTPIDILDRNGMESIILDFNVDGSVVKHLCPKFGTGTKKDLFDFPRQVFA